MYMTLSEKKNICKKLSIAALVVAAVIVVLCVVMREGKNSEASYQAEAPEGMIEIDGVKYVPKKNIETYLFMGVDNMGKVEKTTDYQGAGRCDVIMLMVRDKTDGTYKTINLDRNTMVEQDSLKPDGTYVGTTTAQLALAHENGDGMEISCENVKKAVSNFLGGQKIDGYAAVNMGAIGIINNLAGGVTVTIEDDFSKVDKTMKMGETITLTDEQAIHYVHDRYDVGDESNVQRMKRHEAYKKGLEEKLTEKCNADNSYPLTIYEGLEEYMVTDIDKQKFSKLALLVLKEKDAGAVNIEGTETISDMGFAQVEADEASRQKAVLELFYKEYK